jgi:hypothetical protein
LAARLASWRPCVIRQAVELVDAKDEARAAVDGLARLTRKLAVASIPLQLVGSSR